MNRLRHVLHWISGPTPYHTESSARALYTYQILYEDSVDRCSAHGKNHHLGYCVTSKHPRGLYISSISTNYLGPGMSHFHVVMTIHVGISVATRCCNCREVCSQYIQLQIQTIQCRSTMYNMLFTNIHWVYIFASVQENLGFKCYGEITFAALWGHGYINCHLVKL